MKSRSHRHLEISFPRTDLRGTLAVIPSLRSRAGSERSEGSGEPAAEILRCAQDDRPYRQMSRSHREIV